MGFRDRIAASTGEIKLPDDMLEKLDAVSVPSPERVAPAHVTEIPLEHNARETVIKMLTEAPQLEQEFTFNTQKFGGAAYVQAMRTTLSRVRADAREKKRKLPPFRLLLVRIEQVETHDRVTVVRSLKASLKQKNVYDDILAQFDQIVPGKDE